MLDLGLNNLAGPIPSSWGDSLTLRQFSIDGNPRLCGPLPEKWIGDSSSMKVLLTFDTGIGSACIQSGDNTSGAFDPISENAVPVMSTTLVWPGGNLADLQANGGLAEQDFRLRYRR